ASEWGATHDGGCLCLGVGGARREAASRAGGGRGEGGQEEGALALQGRDDLVGEEDPVFDRRDARFYRIGDARGALGVGGGATPCLHRLLHRGPHFLQGERGRARLHSRRHDAARGDQLDQVGTCLELLADRFPHLV